MTSSMVHWWGNPMCVIDVETTGLDPLIHEIWELSVVPVNSSGYPLPAVIPLRLVMKPEEPELIDWTTPAITYYQRNHLREAIKTGIPHEKAIDLLAYWITEKLKVPVENRIIPLGHNYKGFDILFLKAWLGKELYDNTFHFHARDTMEIGIYLNDRCGYHGEDPMFDKVNLARMCSILNIKASETHQHSAYADCLATAALWRQLISSGLYGRSIPEPSPQPVVIDPCVPETS